MVHYSYQDRISNDRMVVRKYCSTFPLSPLDDVNRGTHVWDEVTCQACLNKKRIAELNSSL